MKEEWNAPRVLFWGTPGPYASQVFQALLQSGIPIVGVVVPDAPGTEWTPLPPPRPPVSDVLMLPSFVTNGIEELAWHHGIPVFSFGGNQSRETYQTTTASWTALRNAVTELSPTVIVVACWHARLPDDLLAIPAQGGVNVHPSRLPYFRGPTPIFWQRRAGLVEGGVSVHAMVHEWDAGDLYAQSAVPFPNGADMETLDTITGAVGGALLVEVLTQMSAGAALPLPSLTDGSYHSYPHAQDFEIPTSWMALHAWNFMRAAESFRMPFRIQGQTDALTARRAVRYEPHIIIPEPWAVQNGEGIAVQFSDGVLVVA